MEHRIIFKRKIIQSCAKITTSNNSNDGIYYFLRHKKRRCYKSLNCKVNVFMLLEWYFQRKLSPALLGRIYIHKDVENVKYMGE